MENDMGNEVAILKDKTLDAILALYLYFLEKQGVKVSYEKKGGKMKGGEKPLIQIILEAIIAAVVYFLIVTGKKFNTKEEVLEDLNNLISNPGKTVDEINKNTDPTEIKELQETISANVENAFDNNAETNLIDGAEVLERNINNDEIDLIDGAEVFERNINNDERNVIDAPEVFERNINNDERNVIDAPEVFEGNINNAETNIIDATEVFERNINNLLIQISNKQNFSNALQQMTRLFEVMEWENNARRAWERSKRPDDTKVINRLSQYREDKLPVNNSNIGEDFDFGDVYGKQYKSNSPLANSSSAVRAKRSLVDQPEISETADNNAVDINYGNIYNSNDDQDVWRNIRTPNGYVSKNPLYKQSMSNMEAPEVDSNSTVPSSPSSMSSVSSSKSSVPSSPSSKSSIPSSPSSMSSVPSSPSSMSSVPSSEPAVNSSPSSKSSVPSSEPAVNSSIFLPPSPPSSSPSSPSSKSSVPSTAPAVNSSIFLPPSPPSTAPAPSSLSSVPSSVFSRPGSLGITNHSVLPNNEKKAANSWIAKTEKNSQVSSNSEIPAPGSVKNLRAMFDKKKGGLSKKRKRTQKRKKRKSKRRNRK